MKNDDDLIASAPTSRGFGIGIIKSANYRTGRDQFQVVRLDRKGFYVTITWHADEADARSAANAEYRADMRAAA